jgi:hypothetical protein
MFLCWVFYYGIGAVSAYYNKGNTISSVSNELRIPSATNTGQASPHPAQTRQDKIYDLLRTLFSALTAVFLFFLYIEMSELTVRGNTSNGEFHQDDNSRNIERHLTIRYYLHV